MMNVSIQLYTQFDFWAIEIKDIFPYTMLSSELQPTDLTSF